MLGCCVALFDSEAHRWEKDETCSVVPSWIAIGSPWVQPRRMLTPGVNIFDKRPSDVNFCMGRRILYHSTLILSNRERVWKLFWPEHTKALAHMKDHPVAQRTSREGQLLLQWLMNRSTSTIQNCVHRYSTREGWCLHSSGRTSGRCPCSPWFT